MTYSSAPVGAGITQLVECQLPKLKVAGSNPVARSILITIALLVTLAGPAACDTATWQLRAGYVPSPTPSALTARVALLLMDYGEYESLETLHSTYSTPTVAEIAITRAPGWEERLRDRLRSGDGTALIPLVTVLAGSGEMDRAALYLEGRGERIPATRRDLALAAAWFLRYEIHPYLAMLPEHPPDMQGDDAGRTAAAVLAAGWMTTVPDGLFHPDAFVTAADLALLAGGPAAGASVPAGTIWLDQLDAFFADAGRTR